MAGLVPGTYTVTVSLTGFKTFVSPDVPILAATPASIEVMLEVGNVEETVVVTAASDVAADAERDGADDAADQAAPAAAADARTPRSTTSSRCPA